MRSEELDNAIKSSFPLYKQEVLTDFTCVEKINVSDYDYEDNYKKHLGLYEKYDEHTNGIITFRTFGAGDYCSYFYRSKSNGNIDGSIVNLPPFYEDNIKLYPDYDLYIYEIGLVKKEKKRSNNSKILNKICKLPGFVLLILSMFILFIPIIILMIFNKMDIVHYNNSIDIILITLNLFICCYLADTKRRKNNELAKKRAIYFNGYKEGYKDCRVQNEKEESHQ